MTATQRDVAGEVAHNALTRVTGLRAVALVQVRVVVVEVVAVGWPVVAAVRGPYRAHAVFWPSAASARVVGPSAIDIVGVLGVEVVL